MKEIQKNINAILDQFKQEELGNRLSQFSWISLKSLINQEFNKLEKEGKQEIDNG